MRETCLIRQPAGLGDILYTAKIASQIITTNKAKRVIWPVSRVYDYIKDYIEIPGVSFVNEEENFNYKYIYERDVRGVSIIDDVLFVNLQRADEVVPTSGYNKPMYCKYELVNLKFDNWYDFVRIKRNYDREKKVETALNLPSYYNLVNRTFCTYPNPQKANIPTIVNELEIYHIDSSTIFDWCGVIEKCNEFHTVNTAFLYIAQILKIKKVFVYPRSTRANSFEVSDLFYKEWKYID